MGSAGEVLAQWSHCPIFNTKQDVNAVTLHVLIEMFPLQILAIPNLKRLKILYDFFFLLCEALYLPYLQHVKVKTFTEKCGTWYNDKYAHILYTTRFLHCQLLGIRKNKYAKVK